MLAQKSGLPEKEAFLNPPTHPPSLLFEAELPFNSVLKRMSVIYAKPPTNTNAGSPAPTSHLLLTKGAFESVWKLCTNVWVDGVAVPLSSNPSSSDAFPSSSKSTSPTALSFWQERVEALAAQGLRVLAFARKEKEGGGWVEGGEDDGGKQREEWETGLTFLGLVGLMDPPRPETLPSVQQCIDAGIVVRYVYIDSSLPTHPPIPFIQCPPPDSSSTHNSPTHLHQTPTQQTAWSRATTPARPRPLPSKWPFSNPRPPNVPPPPRSLMPLAILR